MRSRAVRRAGGRIGEGAFVAIDLAAEGAPEFPLRRGVGAALGGHDGRRGSLARLTPDDQVEIRMQAFDHTGRRPFAAVFRNHIHGLELPGPNPLFQFLEIC